MLIEELKPGQEISLVVNVNNNSLFFTSKVQETLPKKHTIFVDAVFKGVKPVSFRGKGVILDVLAAVENADKPHLFKNVSSTLLKRSNGTFCYGLTTLAESVAHNRRENYRCYIGIETYIQFGPNHAAHEAIIRDISATGFAVVCDNDVNFMQGSLVHVVLNDQIEDFGEKYTFHLYGLVARVQDLENGKLVYGCRLNNNIKGLDAYIMEKDRQHLKRRSGKDMKRI